MTDDLRYALEGLPPKARDLLRRVLIGDQADRDAASDRLRRYRDEAGDELGDVIDLCTLYPEARRTIVRLLAEVDAAGRRWARPAP